MSETRATYSITPTSPAQSQILAMIANNPKLADSTKVKYSKAIQNAVEAGVNLTDPDSLAGYAAGLSKTGQGHLKSALLHWTKDAVDKAMALADPQAEIGQVFETNQRIQASVYKANAINSAIKAPARKGQKAHTWLTQSEVKKLLATCNNNTIQGKRDKIILGLLVGAGLRREELANLTFEAVIVQPTGSKSRTVLNVTGKGAKDRIIPINDKLAQALADWRELAGPGYIARSITKGDAFVKLRTLIHHLITPGVHHLITAGVHQGRR